MVGRGYLPVGRGNFVSRSSQIMMKLALCAYDSHTVSMTKVD